MHHALHAVRVPVEAAVPVAAQREVVVDDVEHARKLGEDHHPVPLLLQPLEHPIEGLHLAAREHD